MKYVLLFLGMIYMHIIDDYFLQGILASMKQKDWWRKQDNYNKDYKYDYIPALIAHATSWSISVNIPVILFIYFTNSMQQYHLVYYVILEVILNAIIHAIIDNMKANLKIINLVKDQIMHLVQIVLIFTTFIMCWSWKK